MAEQQGEQEGIGARLENGLFGDPDRAVIKAGTLAVTRWAGLIAVVLLVLVLSLEAAEWEFWDGIQRFQKIQFVLAIGFIWAIVVAADAIARGIATSKPERAEIAVLPTGLGATRVEPSEVPGYRVLAVKLSDDGDPSKATWLAVKDGEAVWLRTPALEFTGGA